MITGDTAVVATGTAAVSTFVRSAGPRVPTVGILLYKIIIYF